MNFPPDEAATAFDFESIDGAELPDPDAQFWSLTGELFVDLLRWLTDARGGLSSVGARTYVLALYLRPELIKASSLRQIAAMPDAPTRAALSKALLELEEKYGLRPCWGQKPEWTRERFSRSAVIGHENRAQ